MSKIYLGDELIYDKASLPKEPDALMLLKKYIIDATPEMAIALSAGIDVRSRFGYFRVELSTDNLIQRMRKNERTA